VSVRLSVRVPECVKACENDRVRAYLCGFRELLGQEPTNRHWLWRTLFVAETGFAEDCVL